MSALELVDEEQEAEEGFSIQDIEGADWALARLQALERQKAENERIVSGQVAKLRSKLEVLNGRLEKRGDFLRSVLVTYAQQHKPELLGGGKKKSRTLPHGVIGWKATGGKLVVTDSDALLEWAREQPVELNFLRIKEEAAWSEIKLACARTGEVPPGTDVSPEEEEIIIKVDGGVDHGS